ncbi:hypothetical protein C1H46_018757 [Malus baccata]|uniref:Uncharacterized protein n=1 Tax=Malus baccata TaxID=106549 RepID=A0A540MAV5_MALBA|nr:hypothetical protein C1H46_018757 [Malus baccata]
MAVASTASAQPQFIASTGNRSFSNAPLIEDTDTEQIVVPDMTINILFMQKTSWKNLFAYMGPGFLVSIAYIDPGNFETDLQSGAQYKYGVRKLEFLIAFLVLTIAGCFFAELGYAKPDATEVLDGLFVPQLKGNGATGLAISLLGAMVMPSFCSAALGTCYRHNLFLHSALVLSRKIPRSVRGIKGFLDLRLKPWLRNFLTRCLAIVPSLIVAVIGGSAGAGKLIIIASMILSFELPFALIPLLKFTSCKTKMGTHVNSTAISALTWIIGSLLMAINVYYLMSRFIKLLLHNHFKVVGIVFLGMLGFSGMGLYLAGIAYLVFRKNKEATHLLALTTPESRQTETGQQGTGSMYHLEREDIMSMQLPQKRSTEDID